jgi:hypothetical protein
MLSFTSLRDKRSRRDVHGVLEELCDNGLTTFGSAMHNFWSCPSKKAKPQETSDTRATPDTDNISANGNKPQDRRVRSTLKTNTGMKAMNDGSKIDLSDEINLTYDVSDEALETTAGAIREKAGAFTLAFCSGLDTCPS